MRTERGGGREERGKGRRRGERWEGREEREVGEGRERGDKGEKRGGTCWKREGKVVDLKAVYDLCEMKGGQLMSVCMCDQCHDQ